MSFTVDIPSLLVKVDKEFLGIRPELGEDKCENAYLIAVTSIFGRPMFFTVHLESGALFSRLPITAIKCDRFNEIDYRSHLSIEKLQPYSCLNGEIQYISYKHLKDYQVSARIGRRYFCGNYLFTIDYSGKGLTEDPEQFKTHNVVVLSNGSLAALPNNYLLFKDGYFTKGECPKYRRMIDYWTGPA